MRGTLASRICKLAGIRLRSLSTSHVHRCLSSQPSAVLERSIGQPTSYTHPFLMKQDEVTPSLSKLDYESRRSSLMSSVAAANVVSENNTAKAHVVILFGEPITYMTEDIPYPFHQNTNFRYLTGFLEPDSCLIMETFPGDTSCEYKSTLLVRDRDSSKELWHGPRAGVEGALQHTGVDYTKSIEDFPNLLSKFLSEDYTVWYDFQKKTNMQLHLKHMTPFLNKAFDKKINICPISDFIHRQRHIKTENEVYLMGKAGLITAEAFKRVIPISFANINESSIHAMLDCECRLGGAQMLAYPPVVAGGNRANTLHYIVNDQRIKDGELVLVDAGAEYHGYVADITRTWPINGRFSKAQRLVYDAVLRVQEACVLLCRVGATLQQIYVVMISMLAQELVENDVLIDKVEKEDLPMVGRKFCPHHVGHWLGMDVHDTDGIAKSTTLAPGMVVTIEPGIYIRSDDVTVREEFRGIAIRIEDDVLVTSSGPVVLTDACPKNGDDIENLITSR
uniref:Probable Xaa-Pro aminopeptidase 3 n=1 Tax=Phallusia mammillata TaxID=59560 RepID=A0A6F9DXP5_9ASCI|nr:probable Xaa-Pro aminopeptidase 3 [Phallusia mammillata]